MARRSVQEARAGHDGNPELTNRVLNTGLKETPHGWRITKVYDDLKIDAAGARIMAADLAEAEALTACGPHVSTASKPTS